MRWEEPPPIAHSGTRNLLAEISPIIVELKRHPGDWARIRDYPKPASASAKANVLRKHFPDVEFAGRRLGERSAIFARFVEED